MSLLEIKDLTIHYKTSESEVCAVNNVDLCLERGETLGLVGETGAGKTTLALGILNLVPNPPGKILGGSVNFDGESLLDLPAKKMRKIRGGKISMIFQDPMTALNPVMKVGDQIAETIMLHKGLGPKEAVIEAEKMLEMVGISPERGSDYPHQFSGGMKQRVVIAIALACNPMLLLADEPTTALDVTIQAQVLDMINDLKKQLGTSIILITHDLGVVAETCDKVAIMYAGEIVESGRLDQIFNNTLHPYTNGLFESLPSLDKDVERLKPIEGLMPDPANLPSGCKFHPRCPYAGPECAEVNPQSELAEDGHTVKCHKWRQLSLAVNREAK